MNIQLAHTRYETSSENIKAADAIKRKLWGLPAYKGPERVSISAKIAQQPVAAPLWKSREIHFDDHVKRFQASLFKPKYRTFIMERCIEIGVPYADIMGPSRKRYIVDARHKIMFEVWETFHPSYPELSRLFGRSDHTTALSAVNRMKAQRDGKLSKIEMNYRERTSKLDPYMVRRDYLERMSLYTLAAKYGLGQPSMRRYIQEKGWKR